jgi:hypothetical protein
MQLVIGFYFFIYRSSTCFERQALIIRSPSPYIEPPVSVFVCLSAALPCKKLLLEYMKMHGPGNIKKNVILITSFCSPLFESHHISKILYLRPVVISCIIFTRYMDIHYSVFSQLTSRPTSLLQTQ